MPLQNALFRPRITGTFSTDHDPSQCFSERLAATMDILDTGIDAHGRFLDSAYNTNYGVNFVRDTSDIEDAKKRKNDVVETKSDEEYFDGVGMRVCFKASRPWQARRGCRAIVP